MSKLTRTQYFKIRWDQLKRLNRDSIGYGNIDPVICKDAAVATYMLKDIPRVDESYEEYAITTRTFNWVPWTVLSFVGVCLLLTIMLAVLI